MKRLPIILAALTLAACNPPPEPPAPRHAEAAPKPDACAHAGELFDLYVAKRDGEGWTEADALDDLRGRGAFDLAYIVDGVFGDRFGPGGSASARAEAMIACRRGTPY